MSWQESMEQILRDLSRNKPGYRLAVVGIGSREHGDDAAGPEFIARLQKAGLPEERVLLIDAGPVPENFTGPLRRFRPDLVILVDAAWMNQPPGSVALLEEELIDGVGASTHGMPLSLLSGYLREELKCSLMLLAIQPKSTDWGLRIEADLAEVVQKTALEFAGIYSKNISMCSPSSSS